MLHKKTDGVRTGGNAQTKTGSDTISITTVSDILLSENKKHLFCTAVKSVDKTVNCSRQFSLTGTSGFDLQLMTVIHCLIAVINILLSDYFPCASSFTSVSYHNCYIETIL